ncbi:unnamed protein product [Blepharisma stoltei]|uniref:Uncharacterized protein n=1 Tax=Blepharisma stoltei TaxID=1481888 RepID=A0AAU9JA63_9CILI|nr:unnamed protein product [Blepharisma stoltei]
MSELKFKGFPFRKIKEKNIRSKVQLEFMDTLLQVIAKSPHKISLNIPETIIYGYGNQEPYMVFTNDLGHLISVKASKISLIHRFFKRCYFLKRNPFPIIVYKSDKGNLMDSCSTIMSIKEGIDLWKSKLKAEEPVLIQRYVAPCAMYISKLRAFYLPSKGFVQCKLMKNKININGEITSSIRGTPKRRSVIFNEDILKQPFGNDDKFLIRKSEFMHYDEADFPINSSIHNQLEALKAIIEKGNLYGKINVMEILADFVQDYDENWYFINMVGFKTEKIISGITPAYFSDKKHKRPFVRSNSQPKYTSPKKSWGPKILLNNTQFMKSPEITINNIEKPRSAANSPAFTDYSKTPQDAKSVPIGNKRKSQSFSNVAADVTHDYKHRKNSVSVLREETLKDLTFIAQREKLLFSLPQKIKKLQKISLSKSPWNIVLHKHFSTQS